MQETVRSDAMSNAAMTDGPVLCVSGEPSKTRPGNTSATSSLVLRRSYDGPRTDAKHRASLIGIYAPGPTPVDIYNDAGGTADKFSAQLIYSVRH